VLYSAFDFLLYKILSSQLIQGVNLPHPHTQKKKKRFFICLVLLALIKILSEGIDVTWLPEIA
jgi:hypothetical protein